MSHFDGKMSTSDENIKYGIQETDLVSNDAHEIHKSNFTSLCKPVATNVSDKVESSNNLNGLDRKSEYLYSTLYEDFSTNKPIDQIFESENLVVSKNLDDEVGNENNDISTNLKQPLNTMNSVNLDKHKDCLYQNIYNDYTGDEFESDKYAKAIAQYSLENNGVEKIVDYKTNDILGIGSFGIVHKYSDENVKMAVKWLKEDKLTEFKKLPFNAEYKNIKSINHKNLLKLYDYNENKIFTEYRDSFIVLSEYIKTSKEDKMRNAVAILRGILIGLHELHSKGILHRDIKADNVILDSKDLTPKICDFDFAIKLTNNKSASGVYGTPSHMAPEVFDEKNSYSFSADIYSYGCLVIEFLTGQRPWANLKNPQICYEVCINENQPQINAEFGSIISDFLNKCLCFDPNKRYTTTQLLNHPFLNNLC